MVGLVQIIIIMGAAYVVLKGLAILQIGLASPRADRGGLVAYGVACLLLSIVVAAGCIWMMVAQTDVIGDIGGRIGSYGPLPSGV